MVLACAIEMSPEIASMTSPQEISAAPQAKASKGRGNQHHHPQQQQQKRYMQKDGHCNFSFQQTSGEWGHYVTDIYTTLVEIRWRVMLLVFSLAYILSWLTFALLYFLIAYLHGDLDIGEEGPTELNPCMLNVHSFTGAFLFSMETQATIGYGFRGMNDVCMEAIVVVTVQDVLSCFIDTAVIGVVIAKMACARKRAHTVGFSKWAVVNVLDGALCLQWRVGDFRGNHILEGEAQGQLVRRQCTTHPPGSGGGSGGAEVSVTFQDLKLKCRSLSLATPATVVHVLDQHSPLYGLSPQALVQEEQGLELVVSFTYTDDSTGMLRQTRTSYTPGEIRWGQQFQPMLRLGRRHYHADYSLFHQTSWVQVPMMSAQERDGARGAIVAAGSGESSGQATRLKLPARQREKTDSLVLQEAWL
ncbi:inward rectifier potassium channel 16-like isoform X2 [Engraulis encrasicolus]